MCGSGSTALALLAGGGVARGGERDRLLGTALRVVGRRGYAAATCDEGVRGAGLTLVQAQAHFANKRECFLAAYDAAMAVLLDGAGRAARRQSEWAGRVEVVLEYLLLQLAVLPDVARACFVELPAIRGAASREDRVLERLAVLLRPPAALPAAVSGSIVESLLSGGVWDAIRATVEHDGPERLPELRVDLVGWVLRLGAAVPPGGAGGVHGP